jgi:hypothetical protein
MDTDGRDAAAKFLGPLRAASLIAQLAGAVGSVAFMLRAGHRNPSWLLLALFVVWVLAPFAALAWAAVASTRWPVLTRTALYCLMLVISLGSVAIYGEVALGPPRPQAAFAFVVVPPASWLLMLTILPLTALIARRLRR